ncbi:hypothetical protein ECDEC9B_3128 [Escherichia coli DEC9B]|nr:hypothetical protein ECDEC9B_3128 [Escherichia coli DEC9B]
MFFLIPDNALIFKLNIEKINTLKRISFCVFTENYQNFPCQRTSS